MVYATATYQVSHAVFHDAKNSLKQVRLVRSRATSKWYMPVLELSMLVDKPIDNLRSSSAKYVWNQVKDGPCLYSLMRKKKLFAYFAVDDACRLFFDGNQMKEFAEWQSEAPPPPPPAPAGRAARVGESQKRERPEICEADAEKPVRKRLASPPLPPPAAGAGAGEASPSPYEQIVRTWFAENKPLLQEQAIERLMQKEEVRQEAIERVAKELALAARPTAQEMIQKLFEADFQ